jgi:hypothetical protein
MTATEALLQHFLMYLVLPVWLLAGLADYFCHRASHIERTSGVGESLLHRLQFAEVGVPLLAALLLEINAAVLLIMLIGLMLHQTTAVWDVRYANATRRVAPAEQHVHGLLEMSPAVGAAVVTILNWPDFLSLFSITVSPRWHDAATAPRCSSPRGLDLQPLGMQLFCMVNYCIEERAVDATFAWGASAGGRLSTDRVSSIGMASCSTALGRKLT